MRISLDPPGGLSSVRRARNAQGRTNSAQDAEPSNLPVPVDAPRTIPSGSSRRGGEAALHAQVIGERRGLRAGPQVHDEARGAYNSIEWSGSKDRRRPKGGATKTRV